MTYRGIRILNSILLFGLLCALLWTLRRKLGYRATIIFFIASIFGFPLQIPFCMQYSTVTYITLIAAVFFLNYREWLEENGRLYGFFFLIGMMTSFFDLLTFPIWTLGVPLIFAIAMAEKQGQKTRIRDVLNLSVAWGVGYGLFWGTKWILASIFTAENVIADAIRQAGIRSMGDASLTGKKITLFHSIAANMICYSNFLFLIAGLCILVWGIRNRRELSRYKSVTAYVIVAAMPIVWYTVLKSHSYDHSAFTCRGLMVTVFAILMMFGKQSAVEEKTEKMRKDIK